MRCLSLAEVLRERGAHCRFICRNHPGNLNKEIGQRGFEVIDLPFDDKWIGTDVTNPAHAAWLGVDWKIDAEQTKVVAVGSAIDWLIVDHYAIDTHWESVLMPHYRKLMVVDDLADRPHLCDLLLDQTYGRKTTDYRSLVPDACSLLCGSQYALLRHEFATLRPYSLKRRAIPALRELLITMGGIDNDNVTGQVLQALRTCLLPADCRITIIMGSSAPWISEVRKQAQDMLWPTRVLVGVSNMAQLMAESDLAIGAAGTTSWERCCLGLPTLIVLLAENQRNGAATLDHSGNAKLLGGVDDILQTLPRMFTLISQTNILSQLSIRSRSIVDGQGANLVVNALDDRHD